MRETLASWVMGVARPDVEAAIGETEVASTLLVLGLGRAARRRVGGRMRG